VRDIMCRRQIQSLIHSGENRPQVVLGCLAQ
jgi:hypothetical protein